MDQEQEDLHHHEDNNMQVGFVELIEPAADLVFTSIFQSNGSSVPHTNADAIRLWARFLAPGTSKNTVSVPQH